MEDTLQDEHPIVLNDNVFIACKIFKFVAVSAAEIKLGALFVNGKESKNIRLMLQETGLPQPQTLNHCYNKLVTGIANETAKKYIYHGG